MLNRWKNKEKATGPGSSNTLPSKGSAKKKRKTGREGGKIRRDQCVFRSGISTYLYDRKRVHFKIQNNFFNRI